MEILFFLLINQKVAIAKLDIILLLIAFKERRLKVGFLLTSSKCLTVECSIRLFQEIEGWSRFT